MIKHLRLFSTILLWAMILLLFQGVFLNKVFAQNNFWEDLDETSLSQKSTQIDYLRKYRLLKLNLSAFKSFLFTVKSGSPTQATLSNSQILLPMPDGSWQHFKIVEHNILSPELAKKLPHVKTFAGVGLEDPMAIIRMDWTSKGFHAMIISPQLGTIFIEPHHQKGIYTIFNKIDLQHTNQSKRFVCHTDHMTKAQTHKEKSIDNQVLKSNKNNKKASGAELRTYRLAVAATGEYTQFHGGNITAAQDAIITIINRVNAIYMQEVAISFTLVDNSKIVFTDADSDPFDNDDEFSLIIQSQNVINDSIGTTNYDIGHTLSRASWGGLATLGVVCRSISKARGITGIDSPEGEIFAVDFVAHEIGHQFNAPHTFNGTLMSCSGVNRIGSSAYEPGSGSTIMAYAGICDDDNLQDNSDPYFHTKSFDDIVNYSTVGEGNTCPVSSATGNHPPVVEAGVSGYNIPISTPFTLIGAATDVDGDVLTYCWEQYDLGPAGSPNEPMANAPLFRSFPPSFDPTRTFPRLSDILNNTQTFGEILPDYERSLTFRLTVRDNQPVGGVDYDQVSLNVVGSAGPFLVNSPNSNVTYEAGTTQTITWDVANTDLSPISCSQVNILLSTDGGATFPFVLAEQTPNDGTQRVVIPNQPGNQARIKVEAVNNVFFDISNSNFAITAPNQPTFSLLTPSESEPICTPEQIQFDIQVAAFDGFSGTVSLSVNNLPNGLTTSFSQNNFVPTNNTLTLTISNTNAITESGIFEIEVQGSSGAQTKTQSLSIEVISGVPDAPNVLSPVDAVTEVSLKPTFDWEDIPLVNSYEIQVSTDEFFNTVFEIGSDLENSAYTLNNRLSEETTYYWRVKGVNICGEGVFSPIFSFQTLLCNDSPVFESLDVPIIISENGTPTISSRIFIQENYLINDVNILNLNIDHAYIGDMTAILISPAGTEVELFRNICNNHPNIRANLDDEAVTNISAICPPVDSGFYRPRGLLSDFAGEGTAGEWTLQISDRADQDGGSLLQWDLEICITDQSNGNTPPFVSENNGLLSFPRSQDHLIDNTMLLAGDQEDEQNTLQYLINNTPFLGDIQRNGVTLEVGDTFTQADLNNNLITYVPDDRTINLEDSFVFTVRDSQGFQSLKDTFQIILDIANPVEPFIPEAEINIYPNPGSGEFEVEMDFVGQGEYLMQIYDLSGKLLKEIVIQKNTQVEKHNLDLTNQSAGMYIFKLITNQGTVNKRLIKLNE